MSLRNVFQLQAINKKKEKGDVQGLIKIVKGSTGRDDLVFHKALSALCGIGDETVETTLIESLRMLSGSTEEHRILKQEIYEYLGRIATPGAVDVLIEGLGDGNQGLREEALICLALTRNPRAVQPIIDTLTKVRSATKKIVLERLKCFDQDDLFLPCQRAINRNGVRTEMVELMGHIGDDRALDVLISCLSDKTYYARRDAALELGKFREKRAVEALINALSDEDRTLREFCIRSLGKIADPMAKEALWAATKDRDSYVSLAAFACLVEIEKKEKVG